MAEKKWKQFMDLTGLGMKRAGEYFFPGKCYNNVLIKRNFADEACLRMVLGRFLSLTVLIGALIVKVPQILKITNSRSSEGLSYMATFMELFSVTFTCTYNFGKGFPFSSWGESFFILVQVLIILFLMFMFNDRLFFFGVLSPIYVIMVWYLTSRFVSADVLSYLQALVIPLIMSSRLTQVYTTYANQSTGQLSFITSFLNWAGTASRIFTTLQETKDTLMLTMFCTSFVLNGVIVLQFFWYWGREAERRKRD